jgi:hypothetical protein
MPAEIGSPSIARRFSVPAASAVPGDASNDDDRHHHDEDSYLHDAKPPKHQWQRLLAALAPSQAAPISP